MAHRTFTAQEIGTKLSELTDAPNTGDKGLQGQGVYLQFVLATF